MGIKSMDDYPNIVDPRIRSRRANIKNITVESWTCDKCGSVNVGVACVNGCDDENGEDE